MEIKKDILWRVYLSYLVIALVCVGIFSRAFYIQQVQGSQWRSMSDSLHEKIETIQGERGTIYSNNGEMLSTSIPQFDIYIDFVADGLRENGGKLFYANLDSLSYCLSHLFSDKSPGDYKALLKKGYASKSRYYPLKKKVNFDQYQQMKEFPLVRLGKNKSGFIADIKNIRLNPYQLLAFRTIGLERQNSQKVGLEKTYDSLLKGTTGQRLVRYIAGGVSVPVDEDYQVEPENGKDIVTTLDTRIQEIAENALMKMMTGNEAEHGCAIVLEVKTGKVKAIANLGRRPDGTYWEDFNYAMTPTEPGSTFKLATILSVLEDKKYTLENRVNLQGGTWTINGNTVYDAEKHGLGEVTVKVAFEESSNVGMAKLAYSSYAKTPSQYINHLKRLGFDSLTGIDLYGERAPLMYKPGNKYWSATTLPWMAFGYNIAITPMHTAMLYNAVANNGIMMRPYLLNAVQKDGIVIREKQPFVAREKICSDETLKQLKECLEGVCTDGTAKTLFKNSVYPVAGKTGTALVANGSRGYADHIYQSSFAGFFPANDPQYTCVVVIKNKANAAKFYGAAVAGPVFKEIADRLYAMNVHTDSAVRYTDVSRNDSAWYSYTGSSYDLRTVLRKLDIQYKDSLNQGSQTARLYKQHEKPVLIAGVKSTRSMPALAGMGLKDALYMCENLGLDVKIKGAGKVITQSLAAGQPTAKGQLITLQLDRP